MTGHNRTVKTPLNIALCVALVSSALAPAMGLLPKSEGKAAWEALQPRALESLGGNCAAVKQPRERVSAGSVPSATRGDLPPNAVITARLHPMSAVRFVLGPKKKRGKPQDAGGLLALNVPATGTYVLGTVSQAWIDLVDRDQNTFASAKHYVWVDFCDRRMKAGIFDLRAGARYWIQVSASPDPVLDLFVVGPLN